nr:MAG TPA: hypothetical protein [Caudoviricetes sp.]
MRDMIAIKILMTEITNERLELIRLSCLKLRLSSSSIRICTSL